MNLAARIILPASLISAFCLLYSGALDGLYTGRQGWLVALIILAGIPLLTAFSIKEWFPNAFRLRYILGSAALLINAPVYTIWLDKHEKDIYRERGVTTKAIVTSALYDFEVGSYEMYYEFEVRGQRFKSDLTHDPGYHAVGDTLTIVYNPDHPNMNEPVAKKQ